MAHIYTLVLVPASAQNMQEAVAQLLAPYDTGTKVAPCKIHLSQDEIQEMAQVYKTESLEKLAEPCQDWNGYQGGLDNKGLAVVCDLHI